MEAKAQVGLQCESKNVRSRRNHPQRRAQLDALLVNGALKSLADSDVELSLGHGGGVHRSILAFAHGVSLYALTSFVTAIYYACIALRNREDAMQSELLTTDELATRIKYDSRTIRERLKDSVLIEGIHYIRPF